MPLQVCYSNGAKGIRWGKHGKCYTGDGAKTKALKQAEAIRASGWTENLVINLRNPLRMDPSRTGMLRRRFERSVVKRFNQLKQAVRRLIVDEDAFGLKRQNRLNVLENMLIVSSKKFSGSPSSVYQTFNTRWRFHSQPEKAAAFQRWLTTQIELTGLVSEAEDAYYRAYIKEGYQKGMTRMFDDTRKAAMQEPSRVSDFYEGTKQEFLRSAFDHPQSLEKVKLLAGRTLTDLKGVTEVMSTQMSRTLLDGFVKGDNPLKIARQMTKDIDGIGIVRARTIARTEVIRAHAEGQLDSLERQGAEKVGVMSEWHTAGDDRVCDLCMSIDGIVITTKEARGLIPRHPNCLPGDSLVTSRSRITAASKRWFDGDLVIIETASGHELSCTPNHPILTNQGWLPAESLNLSSKVVCDKRSKHKRRIDGDYQNIPSTIHDIAESILSSRQVTATPVPLTAKDFHGDATEGEIAVIGTDGCLTICHDTSFLQRLMHFVFQRRNIRPKMLSSLGVSAKTKQTLLSSSNSIVSCFRLLGSLLLCHLTPFKEFCFGPPPNVNSRVNQSFLHDPATDTQFLSQLVTRLPRGVLFDDVVNINRRSVSCHVYNLQTEDEWYTANGIITHNCRCAFIPANVGESPKGQLRSKKEIRDAMDESIGRERPKRTKRTLAEQKQKTKWAGADKTIAAKRPKSIFDKPISKIKPKGVVIKPKPKIAPVKPSPISLLRPKVIKPKPKPKAVKPRVVELKPKPKVTPVEPRDIIQPTEVERGVVQYPSLYHGSPSKHLKSLKVEATQRTQFGAKAVISTTENPALAKAFTRGELGDLSEGAIYKLKGPFKILDLESVEGRRLWKNLGEDPRKLRAAGYDGVRFESVEADRIKAFYKDIKTETLVEGQTHEIQVFRDIQITGKMSQQELEDVGKLVSE